MRRLGNTLAHTFLPKNSTVGNVDPTVNDDTGEDFDVGSMWITRETRLVFVCTDNTSGAAVWTNLGLLFPLSNYAATAAPTANDDSTQGYEVGSLWVNINGALLYICFNATAGAAVWKRLITSG